MDTDAPRRFLPLGASSVSVMLALLAAPPPARADGPAPQAMDIWQRDKLSGDWGGARTETSRRGLDISLNYVGETLGILAGGFRQGADYEHRFELSFDTDLDK